MGRGELSVSTRPAKAPQGDLSPKTANRSHYLSSLEGLKQTHANGGPLSNACNLSESGDQGRKITTSVPVWTTEGAQAHSGQISENLRQNTMERDNRKVLAYKGKVLGSNPSRGNREGRQKENKKEEKANFRFWFLPGHARAPGLRYKQKQVRYPAITLGSPLALAMALTTPTPPFSHSTLLPSLSSPERA